MFLRRFILWTAVCSVSAAPSFLWAMGDFDRTAMVVGVGCFILMMTLLTCTARFERFRVRPFVRRTLYIGYGGRMLLSLAFPLGMMADMWPGLISVAAIEATGLDAHAFTGTLLTTLLQGTVLNVVLSVLMLIVYGIQRFVCKRPAVDAVVCSRCGYDRRGSLHTSRCPECGTEAATPPTKRAA